MYTTDRIYAWAFEGKRDPEIKHYMLSMYVEHLRYFDPVSADELSLWLTLNEPTKAVFGEQLQIPIDHEQKKTRI